MIVLDNIIFSIQEAGGISVFWRNLISQFQSIRLPRKYIVLPDAFRNLERSKLDFAIEPTLPAKWYGKALTQFIHPHVKSDRPFIFHSSYYRTSDSPGAINVTTVHDFIVQKHPLYFTDKLRIRLNHKAIRQSHAVVCVSQTTRDDLFRFIPDVNPGKVHVIPNGVSDTYRKLDHTPFPEYSDCLLYVGGRKFYKNFAAALRVAAQSNRRLLICGAPLTPVEQLRADTLLPSRYKSFAYPSDEELNRIYNSVYALIYPSQSEGFGLPVLEAQRAGCPVIAMQDTAPAEVGGDAVLTFPLDDETCITELIKQLECPQVRQTLIERGYANSAHYTWQSAASRYIELYHSLLPDF